MCQPYNNKTPNNTKKTREQTSFLSPSFNKPQNPHKEAGGWVDGVGHAVLLIIYMEQPNE